MVRLVQERPRDHGNFLAGGPESPPAGNVPSRALVPAGRLQQYQTQQQTPTQSNANNNYRAQLPPLPVVTSPTYQNQAVVIRQPDPPRAQHGREAPTTPPSPGTRASSSHSTRQYVDTRSFQDLYLRLRDNERTQKQFMNELVRLQSEVSDNFRHHDIQLRDEAATRRILEDQARFLKMFVSNIRDQIVGLNGQLQLEREATVQAIEMFRGIQTDVSDVRDKSEKEVDRVEQEVRRETQRLDNKVDKSVERLVVEIQACRSELMHARESMERNVKDLQTLVGELRRDLVENLNEVRKSLFELNSHCVSLDKEVNSIRDHMAVSESRLSSAIATQESNLAQASKLLSEAISSVKVEETNERNNLAQSMKTEMDSLWQLVKVLQTTSTQEIQPAIATLDKSTSSHSGQITQIQSQVAMILGELQTKSQRQEEVNGDLVKALLSVKENLGLLRDEVEGKKMLLHKEVERAKVELRREVDLLKEEFKADIRKVERPVIVM